MISHAEVATFVLFMISLLGVVAIIAQVSREKIGLIIYGIWIMLWGLIPLIYLIVQRMSQ
jgi:hypothetical protein